MMLKTWLYVIYYQKKSFHNEVFGVRCISFNYLVKSHLIRNKLG
jgi:hypothetical protein